VTVWAAEATSHAPRYPASASRQCRCSFHTIGQYCRVRRATAERGTKTNEIRRRNSVSAPRVHPAYPRPIFPPSLHQHADTFGMDRDFPSAAVRPLRRETGVVMPTLVKELIRTIRQMAPRERGDRVDDLSKLKFRLLRVTEHPL